MTASGHKELIDTGMILGLLRANERRRYKVTPSIIGWAQTQNQPCWYIFILNIVNIFNDIITQTSYNKVHLHQRGEKPSLYHIYVDMHMVTRETQVRCI